MEFDAVTVTWEEIDVLDRVGLSYEPVKEMSAERKARILLLAHRNFGGDYTVSVVHEEGGRTYLRGWCPHLGLDNPGGTERECEELRGSSVKQVVFGMGMVAYVLTNDGVLFSCGNPVNGQLGRRATHATSKTFAPVAIDDQVLAVAAGAGHVLAMTATKVFGFGLNNFQQASRFIIQSMPGPLTIFSGEGRNAPKQVACGSHHSVILTVGGRVFTCGEGGRSGHGHRNNIRQMTQVKSLCHVTIQQIGCTECATFALVDQVLYGWGDNPGGCMCLGRAEGENLEPTLVHCGGRRIESFRSSYTMVLALTNTGEALYWGVCNDLTMDSSPRHVEGRSYPREIFTMSAVPDSGGTVYLVDNYSRAAASFKLRGAKTKITKLENAVDEGNKREQAANDARAAAETKLERAKTQISQLENDLEGATRREADANDARRSAEENLREANTQITALQSAIDKARRKEMIALESSSAARKALHSLVEETRIFQSRVAQLQLELETGKDHATHAQEDQNTLGTRVRSLEQENSEQRRDEGNFRINYRKIAMDYPYGIIPAAIIALLILLSLPTYRLE